MTTLDNRFKTKPLSANKMFGARGKRTFKSPEYVAYQNEIRDDLMGTDWPFKTDPVSFIVNAGLSNRGADIDNVIKPIFDTYQGIFEEFNDNKVYYVELHKEIVSKGEEFLRIRVASHNGA